MIVACGEWGFRDLEMEDHFRICRRFGFHYMEFGIGGDVPGRLPEEMSRDQISQFAALGNKYDIETPFCCLVNDFTLPDQAAHGRMVEKTIASIRLAAELGARLVRLFAGFTPARALTEEIWERMLDAFVRCEPVCADLGLTIAVETHGKVTFRGNVGRHEHTASTDRGCLGRLFRELPATIGFCYDPGNMRAVQPDDERYALDLLNDRINYVHLKDWHQTNGGWVTVAPGDDALDYARLLPKVKYQGVYTIEYEPTEDVQDGIQRSLDYLQRIGQSVAFS